MTVQLHECPLCHSSKLITHTTAKDYTTSGQTFQITKCRDCTFTFTNPRPTDLAPYYHSPEYVSHSKKPTGVFDFIYNLARIRTLTWKERIISKYSTERLILDYGCGTSALLGHLKKKGWTITGVEPSEVARNNKPDNVNTAEIKSTLDEVTSNFPIITLWHVLEHVDNLDDTLLKLTRKLKKNGTLIIAVPNINSWESTHYGAQWAAYDVPRHLWHFSPDTMAQLLKPHRLKVVNTIPMKLDAYYISMLSEKYLNNENMSLQSFIKGMIYGMKSNIQAKKTGNYSSLIYVIKHEV